MANSIITEPGAATPEGRIDIRQQLFNDGLTGPVGMIQIPTQRITRLLAFMYDLDARLLLPDNPLVPPAADPRRFYENIRPVLERHPLARRGEVRSSGGGLHVIVPFGPPVELVTAADQQKWATMIRPAQYSLPADPNAPGITALTRPVGSVNSKNGATVEVIKPGEPIDPREVEAFVRQLLGAPFRTVATILLGDERILPCPACRGEGTRLDVLDHAGICYARCGKVSLARLYDCVLRPFEPTREAGKGAAGKSTPAGSRPGKAKRPAATKSTRK